jgi:hypothetical protein
VLPVLLAIAGGIVYVLVTTHHGLLPDLSVDAPITVGVLGAAEAYVARGTRNRLAGRPRTKPIEPITVARLAALGKASAIVGAPVTGAYAGLLGRVLQLDSPVARSDVRVCLAGIGCALLLTLAGLALESVCRVKNPPGSGEA